MKGNHVYYNERNISLTEIMTFLYDFNTNKMA